MNADVYRGLWGGSKCRDSIAQVAHINKIMSVNIVSVSKVDTMPLSAYGKPSKAPFTPAQFLVRHG
jgi:hypothetical protein